jgi:hypothetical protein
MLQNIRDHFTGKFAIGLIALIAVSFVFWGVSSPFIGGGYAAKVDGVEISLAQLEQDYRRQLAQYVEQFGELPESFRRPLRERVLGSLVRNTVVDSHVVGEGFRISDETVAKDSALAMKLSRLRSSARRIFRSTACFRKHYISSCWLTTAWYRRNMKPGSDGPCSKISCSGPLQQRRSLHRENTAAI